MAVDVKMIIEKIQKGLKSCSEKRNIPAKDVQLKISSTGVVHLWNADQNICQVDVLKVFEINAFINMAFPIVPYLKKAVLAMAKEKKINPETAVARIFTKQDDFYPSVWLQDVDKQHCEITIDDLLK